ncbi:MAG: hypothetical protein Q9159_002760 [Coniocarpon cinnabarinum]
MYSWRNHASNSTFALHALVQLLKSDIDTISLAQRYLHVLPQSRKRRVALIFAEPILATISFPVKSPPRVSGFFRFFYQPQTM